MIGTDNKSQNASDKELVAVSDLKSGFDLIANLNEMAGINSKIITNAPRAIFIYET